MSEPRLSAVDAERVRRSGRDPAEVEAQWAQLRGGVRFRRLLRPCTVGDGIERLAPERLTELASRYRQAKAEGRLTAFVPASGAASRMFASLQLARGRAEREALRRLVDSGDLALGPALTVLERIGELAVWDELGARPGMAAAFAEGQWNRLVDGMLDDLGLAGRPKALVPFHRAAEGVRTAFDEHLAEAARLVADDTGRVRLHMTVSPEHRDAFLERLAQMRPRIEASYSARLDVWFTAQDPATDTVAMEADGTLVRDGDGFLFRPGGHGALLRNLAGAGDVVLVKNIDNIVPERLRPLVVTWRAALVGRALELEARVHGLLRRFAAGERPNDEALALLRDAFGVALPGDVGPAAIVDRLDRPLRVCGVVRNDGQPGGGPFFVADADGHATPQIVESAEVDGRDPAQKATWNAATHFNPVELVCLLRDFRGERHRLASYVDPAAAIVTAKSHDGRTITVLEHPGLWNGAMAGWNTVFVEVPRETFNPVKTLADLLGDGHRA